MNWSVMTCSNVLEDGFWIYNDLPKARAEAERTGKPLLVIFRCIPCEACAQLDREIMERDPLVQRLMTQYVCLRIVHANGMDLSLFQFDYDQSFAAFVMNADNTIYGRYGTRSHQTESADDVSLKGFATGPAGWVGSASPAIRRIGRSWRASSRSGSPPLHRPSCTRSCEKSTEQNCDTKTRSLKAVFIAIKWAS